MKEQIQTESEQTEKKGKNLLRGLLVGLFVACLTWIIVQVGALFLAVNIGGQMVPYIMRTSYWGDYGLLWYILSIIILPISGILLALVGALIGTLVQSNFQLSYSARRSALVGGAGGGVVGAIVAIVLPIYLNWS